MVDFQQRKCDPVKMDSECDKMYSCIQRKNDTGVMVKSISLVTFSIKEVKDTAFLPFMVILMILLYQIAITLNRREDKEPTDWSLYPYHYSFYNLERQQNVNKLHKCLEEFPSL